VTTESDRETGGSEEQTDPFLAFCREMMNGMADCGSTMERMMASCMAVCRGDAAVAEDREQTDD
jgi:hypothetical protein